MININLIKDQILLRLPNSVRVISSSEIKDEENKALVYLDIENFGRVTMYNNFDIQVTYKNPVKVGFKYFKEFFDSRLQFENASAYIYEDRISIFKRVMSDHGRSDFENSMQISMNFIHTSNTIMSFIEYIQAEQKE